MFVRKITTNILQVYHVPEETRRRLQMLLALFPPFLNPVSVDGKEHSRGPAVFLLQVILLTLKGVGYISSTIVLELTGIYDGATRAHVRELQIQLGFPAEPTEDSSDPWADGCFGPATRARLRDQIKIDVNAIPAEALRGFTRWVDQNGVTQTWASR